jgi:anti-anti-sigma factor
MAELDNDAASGDETASDSLIVDVDVDVGAVVIRVEGEIDVATADDVRAAVVTAIEHRPARLVFDLSAVDFMDSSGIAVLLEAAKQTASVQIRRPSAAVRRVIEVTGLSDVLPIGE